MSTPVSEMWDDRIPKGKWMCPYCLSVWELKELDRILAERDSGVDAAGYYVKFKGRSYRHCDWISKSMFEDATVQFPWLKSKLRAFEDKIQVVTV